MVKLPLKIVGAATVLGYRYSDMIAYAGNRKNEYSHIAHQFQRQFSIRGLIFTSSLINPSWSFGETMTVSNFPSRNSTLSNEGAGAAKGLFVLLMDLMVIISKVLLKNLPHNISILPSSLTR